MRQKTWKRRLALALAAAMTLNTGILTSFAKWENKGGDWYYTNDETGVQAKGEVKKIRGEWYSFDENGVMETDRRIDLDGATFYITPGGEFAVNKWMFLDDEGHKCTHEGGCDCKWYRFGEIVKESGKPFSGGMVKDTLKEVQGKWYSFDPETGVMKSDELLSGISKDKPWEKFYATENGDLAKGWMLLTADHHKPKDADDETFWYFFRNPAKGNGMAYDDVIEDKDGKKYAVDTDGHMVSNTWYLTEKDEDAHYYQHSGEMAVNKWLPFEDEGAWYHFDANGKKYEEEAFEDVASPSGAKRIVSSIELKGEVDREVLIGTTVQLEFQIATSSNAKRSNDDWSEYHDIWFNKLEGRAKYAGSNGDICIVEYQNNNINEEGEEISLFIDGVESTGSFRVCTVAPKSDKQVQDVLNKIESSIGNSSELSEEEKAEVAAQVKVVYEAASDDKKQDLQKKWLKDPNSLKDLEKAYAEANGLADPTKSVTKDARELLLGEDAGEEGIVKIDMVGGNLNVENPGDSVELALAVPKEGWKDKLSDVKENVAAIKEDTVTVALDLTFLLNNENQTKLKVPVVITMSLPASVKQAMANNMEAVLINIHDNGIYLVESNIGKNEITFVTDKFSTYVFVLNSKPEEDPGTNTPSTTYPSSSGGGRSSGGSRSTSNIAGTLAGQWMQDEIGWWFRLNDGSYAVNSWQYVAYNGTARWYRFDEKGYICKGWFTDTDGHRYYLNPVSDGLMGAMLTGWQKIDGIWYYFNTVSDGTQGALLVNTTTPDGYSVDANGQWIQ